MKIATKERYALKMMADLASRESGEPVSLTGISARQGISVSSLGVVARALVKAGLVEADNQRLHHYRLALPPEAIPLQVILQATDGRFACMACTETDPDACRRYRICSRVHFWEGLQETGLPLHEIHMTLKSVSEYFARDKKPRP